MWFSFGWSTMRKFSEGPGLSIGPFQKYEHKVMHFPYVVIKTCRKLSKNCSIHGKNREKSAPYNF